MVLTLLAAEKPDYIAVAFDVSRQTFRTEAFPDYKATRSSSPPEFKGQVELIRQVLDALQIRSVSCEGFEADDIIATLTTQATAQGAQVLIVTGDRDSFQLVNDDVTVLYPVKGVSELARMTPQAVQEKYGLTPTQYPDYAALRGDPSDNLPGVPGVGEKTAAKWINQYGTLAALIDHADEVTGKVGQAFRDHLPQVMINRDLTALRHDAPVDLPLAECAVTGWDRSAVDELFAVLQFRSLRERLKGFSAAQPANDAQPAATQVPTAVAVALTAQTAPSFLESLTPPVSVACQGTFGRGTGTVHAVAFADASGSVGVMECHGEARELAMEFLASAVRKNMHDAKGPMLALLATGRAFKGLQTDTALAAYVCAPDQRGMSLSEVAERYLGRSLVRSDTSEQLTLDSDAADLQALGAHAQAIAELAGVLTAKLVNEGTEHVLRDMEQPLAQILARMESAGIGVDLPQLGDLSLEFGQQMKTAEDRAHQIVGRPFNLGSPKQLQEVLFAERGLPKTKKIKTGYTTDAESLQWLYATTNDPVLEQLLAWRDKAKLRQTVDGLIPLADAHHRIHTTFNQTVAATGRLSSTDPNLQNIPIRTEAGRRIRGCFVVGPGYESLMTADYSQIEMRIMAHASADAGLIAAFVSGEDLHTTVAAQVFGVPPASVDPEMRRRIKAMSYGLAYGLSPFGLSQQLDISPEEARRLMDTYFERFGGVRDYLAKVVEEARVTGYTQTLFGRRRYLPDLNSDNRQRREMAERMALNAPIQGTAADIVKQAMLDLDAAMTEAAVASRVLLQVHDELVLEIAHGEEHLMARMVRSAMSGAAHLRVPLDVQVGVGRNWEAAAH